MPIEPKNREFRGFDDLQQESLGNYIYALRDPRDNKVFYIGQATKNRIFDHFVEAEGYLNGWFPEASPKTMRIIEIWSENENVDWFIVAHGLNDDTNTLDAVESAAIDLLTNSQNGSALNRVTGPHSTFLNQDMLTDLGATPINPDNQLSTVYIFPIQRQLANGLNPYESTRRAWYVAERFRNIEGAIAVGLSDYISRGVFNIDHWRECNDRHEFDGQEANLPDLMNKNWYSIISSSFGYWQRGNYLIVAFNGNGQYRFIRGNPDKDTWYKL
jgi:hypothetical protein